MRILNNDSYNQSTKYLERFPLALVNERDKEPLITLLDELGGWPVLDGSSWDNAGFDYLDLMANLRLLNNRVLISQWVGADDKNSSRNIIHVGNAIH